LKIGYSSGLGVEVVTVAEVLSLRTTQLFLRISQFFADRRVRFVVGLALIAVGVLAVGGHAFANICCYERYICYPRGGCFYDYYCYYCPSPTAP